MRATIILLLAAFGAAGCISVPAYQREHLTSPAMNAELEEGETAFQAHVFDSREGATGGLESTGGGCGCN